MRLIDADKLLEMIEERIEESGKHRMAVLAEEVIDVINDYAEDYEDEPVKHGRWLTTRDENKKLCSECGVIHLIAQYPCGRARYCPNCGAKMDGGAD